MSKTNCTNCCEFPLGETFRLSGVPDSLTIQGRLEPCIYTPPKEDAYVFRREVLSDFLAWFRDEQETDGLLLVGDTATGKSSLVVQVCAHLNLPLHRVTANEQMELSELVGSLVPRPDGSLRFRYGPLALAMKRGEVFLLDEFDYLDPGVVAGLNGIIEGEPLTIPQSSVVDEHGNELEEVIQPQPGFRFVATGNTAGGGDGSGMYLGTQRQNMALLDRMMVVHMEYPSPEVEAEIIKAKEPKLPNEILERMLKVTAQVRRLFAGEEEGPQIPATLSTRVLLRWARLTVKFKGVRAHGHDPVHYALDRAIANRLDPVSKEALHEIVQRHFGVDETGA